MISPTTQRLEVNSPMLRTIRPRYLVAGNHRGLARLGLARFQSACAW
jgi:hypothetical protein